MAKIDLSVFTNTLQKAIKALTEMADGKDGERILEALEKDFDQLNKDLEAKAEKAKERYETFTKLTKANYDLTNTINETRKQARKLKSAIGVHKKKLETWENKPKRTKLTAIKIDELKEAIAREEEALVALEKTIANNEIQLNQMRIEISKTSTSPDTKTVESNHKTFKLPDSKLIK